MKKLHLILLLFATISLSAQKNVLVEELTGTWCQYCPGGIYYGDSLCQTHENVIFVAIHTSDVMANEDYTDASGLTSAPTANIGRHLLRKDIGQWFSSVANESGVPASATISVSNDYNAGTRLLTSTVTATALTNISGSYRLAAIVVEDCVHGSSSAYNQTNHYAGTVGYMGGFENMPNPVPYDRMAYDHVGRYLMGGYDGAENSFPSSLTSGQSASYEFSYTLPNDYNPNYVRVIGLLIKNDGTVDNAGISIYLDGNDNAAPIFTSVEKTEAFVGAEYLYNIYTHDTEGSTMTITASTLPNWLTFEQTGSKTAVLSGTPSAIGDYEVTLEVSDGERVTEQTFTISVEEQLDGEWKYIGERAFNGTESEVFDMASYGNICYIFAKANNIAVVYKSVDGGDWESVGNTATQVGLSGASIDIASNGDIYIGFTEDGPNWSSITHIMKYDGNEWTELAGAPDAIEIDLKLDSNDTPYFVSRHTDGYVGFVDKYIDGQWVTVGDGSYSTENTMWAKLAIDSNDIPYILYCTYDYVAHCSKFVDGQWVEIGENVTGTSKVYYYMSFGISEDGVLYAMIDNFGTRYIDVFSCENDVWNCIGTNVSNGTSEHNDLVINDGLPYIVFEDDGAANTVSVMGYDGERWNYVGQRGFTQGTASYPQITVKEGNIVTAFLDDDQGSSVSAMEYVKNTTSVVENQFVKTSKINCYPTIASSELNIESEIEGEAMIFNINGVCVMTFILKNGQNKLEINNLPNGFYIINLKGEKACFIVK